MTFPRDFVFGAATAAYQIEGSVTDGGRTPSIWDTFSAVPGTVRDGDTGAVASDHYRRWDQDVALMKEIGLTGYRFSLSWSRVMRPDGSVNTEGVAFYRRLLDALAEAGIRPLVTLYHWDLPQYLHDAGGWTSRETAVAFADYARVAARAFGDRVPEWITINEPWCAAFLGYAAGVHAPGLRDDAASLAAAHHLNLAHGLAAMALREELGEDARVGIALNLHVVHPEDPENDAHLEAVKRIQRVGNHIFLGPLLEGTYPIELVTETRHITPWSFVKPGDLEVTRQRLDFLGVNYYTADVVRPRTGEPEPESSPWVGASDIEFVSPSGPTTEMGWAVVPEGLYELLTALDNVQPDMPLLITENGAAFPDRVIEGKVPDGRRIEYLRSHLGQVERALDVGVTVAGYYVWSLLDNFEWAEGYSKRFGLVHVDYETGERSLKESALWYRDVIASHREAARARDAAVAAEQAEAARQRHTPRRGFFARLFGRS